MTFYIVFTIHAILCISLVVLVLLQQGKGADAGMVMGAGAANSILGAGATASFISKLTTSLAVCFMITSIILVKIFGSEMNTTSSLIGDSVINKTVTAPAEGTK